MPQTVHPDVVKAVARDCGFDLAGIAPAAPLDDFARFEQWKNAGMAGDMNYMTDHRAGLRSDPRQILGSAKSILCVGKLYQSREPYSTTVDLTERGWIARYAWSEDYHDTMRVQLNELVRNLQDVAGVAFDYRICIDTAPLLERSLARLAGLGWIGRNTCLINQQLGSWLFLGEILLGLELAPDLPAPERCGTCRRCIDACPTGALVPQTDGTVALDARLCISYLTIEKRGAIDPVQQKTIGPHVFGCDICQEVCPWNRRHAGSGGACASPDMVAPPLAQMADLTEDEFRRAFRKTPVWRTKYKGFLRNVAMAMGNSPRPEFREPLERLAAHPDPAVAEAARESLKQFKI